MDNNVIKNTDVIYLNYFDVIDLDRVNILMSVSANLISQYNPKILYFLFSSPGGDVRAGITFYNFLKALPCEIIMHNNGSIDSIGNIIFLAAKKENRIACPHSSFLFHGVSLNMGQMQLSLNKIQEFTSYIKQDEEKIAGIIVDNTLITKEEIKNLFFSGEVKDVNFAFDKGIINHIKNASIPHDKLFINITCQSNNK